MRLLTHPKLRITQEAINDVPYFREVWRGILNSTVFRNLIHQSLDVYKTEINKEEWKENQPLLLFADVRELELIKKEDIDWLSNVINEEYRKIGFTHQAVIQPVSTFASETVAPYASENKAEPIITKIFTDEKEALKWLWENQ